VTEVTILRWAASGLFFTLFLLFLRLFPAISMSEVKGCCTMRGDKARANSRYTAAVFRHEEELFAAAWAREPLRGPRCYTPFPVHGMDQAAGLKRSRLTWIALIAGAIGLMFGLGLQVWTGL
jgi:hypothetical protein